MADHERALKYLNSTAVCGLSSESLLGNLRECYLELHTKQNQLQEQTTSYLRQAREANEELAELRTAQQDMVMVPKDESAWLVESVEGRWGTGFYWAGVAEYGEWGTIDKAVRFKRKEDAERVIASLLNRDGKYMRQMKYEACEHEWPPSTRRD